MYSVVADLKNPFILKGKKDHFTEMYVFTEAKNVKLG